MPTPLASCRLPTRSPKLSGARAVLVLSIALIASLVMSLAPRSACAEPVKRGAPTAALLAQESAKPTPGVDAPKAVPHRSVHHRTAQAKAKAKAKPAAGAKQVGAKGAKTTAGKPALAKPASAKQVGSKPGPKPKPAGPKPTTAPKPVTKPAGARV